MEGMDNICRQCLMVGGLYVVSGEREGELTGVGGWQGGTLQHWGLSAAFF